MSGDSSLGPLANSVSSPTSTYGQIYFLAENTGPDDPHELVVIKTDLAPEKLPNVDGKVDEDQVELIGEIEEFAVGSLPACSTWQRVTMC